MLTDPQKTIDHITQKLRTLYEQHDKETAVIAVSGGIDSAVALTLLTKAIGPEHVQALLLPFGDQSSQDQFEVTQFNNLPAENVHTLPITQPVEVWAKMLDLAPRSTERTNKIRLGNVMARCRMIAVYDFAWKYDALVCGTENKSEKFLGYFTRFGDEASDIEPLQDLFKTEVRMLAEHLGLPEMIITKQPSAGLWQGQNDESELGFSYQQADLVLEQLDEKILKTTAEIDVAAIAQRIEVERELVARVVDRVIQTRFKHQVPYHIEI